MKEHADKALLEDEEHRNANDADDKVNKKLRAEGVHNAHLVAASVELGGENTRARNCAEYKKNEYKCKLVNDGNAAHLLCAERANHNVVEEVYEVGNTVLNDHRNGDGENSPVKLLRADKFLFQLVKI